MNETRKIALACCIGGMLCSFMALLLTPKYWYFGIPAGLAGGYFAYEFRQVLSAVHASWRRFKIKVRRIHRGIQPLGYVLMGTAFDIWVWSMVGLCHMRLKPGTNDLSSLAGFAAGTLAVDFVIFIFLLALLIISSLTFSRIECWLAIIGANQEGFKIRESGWDRKIYLFRVDEIEYEFEHGDPARQLQPEQARHFTKVGAKFVVTDFFPASWRQIKLGATLLRHFIVECYEEFKAVILALWDLAVACCKGSKAFVLAVCMFPWTIFKLIHSNKRLLCAIDGTIGGVASYLFLATSAETLPQQALLVLFGGLSGAGLGILNWELVSKRVFHFDVQPAPVQ